MQLVALAVQVEGNLLKSGRTTLFLLLSHPYYCPWTLFTLFWAPNLLEIKCSLPGFFSGLATIHYCHPLQQWGRLGEWKKVQCLGFPIILGTILGVPIIWTIVFGGLYWGSIIVENYHTDTYRTVFFRDTFIRFKFCTRNPAYPKEIPIRSAVRVV